MANLENAALTQYLARILGLPLVRDAAFEPWRADGTVHPDGVLRIETPHGTHRLAVELKRTYLDRA